jgi:hypothetical protein
MKLYYVNSTIDPGLRLHYRFDKWGSTPNIDLKIWHQTLLVGDNYYPKSTFLGTFEVIA